MDFVLAVVADEEPLEVMEPGEGALDDPAGAAEAGAVPGLAAGEIEWSRAVADSSHVQAKKGAPRRARARLIEPETAPSITFL